MKKLLALLLLVQSVLFSAGAIAQELPAPSYWKNERGSELFVWSVNGGALQGAFTNHAPGFACQGIPYPVSGSVNSTGLYFVVTFARCNSFTRWVGTITGSQMPTSWTLFYVDNKGNPRKLKGADIFTRVR